MKEPKIDFGYYAAIPRLIRTGYKDLSPVQKWLYVCLKDLCGDSGTCYRSLRVLAEETGISIGMLSESVRVLHEKGLIHAEKKKRSTGGKEVWHITVVDIWQLNGKAHPTVKCSHSEQTSENVHPVNKNVHTANKNLEVCSPSEQECSHSEQAEFHNPALQAVSSTQNEVGRKNNRRKNITKERTEKKEGETTPSSSNRQSSSSLSLSPSLPVSPSFLDQFTEKQRGLWSWWCELSKCPPEKLNERAYEHVCSLAEKIDSQETLRSVYHIAYKRVRALKGQEATPPQLGNLDAAYSEWYQAQQEATQKPEQERAREKEVPSGQNSRPVDPEKQRRLEERRAYIQAEYKQREEERLAKGRKGQENGGV